MHRTRAAAAPTSPRGSSSRACRALLVARVGDDVAGRRRRSRSCGARASSSRSRSTPLRATGTCVVIVEPSGERTMLPDRGANAALAPADLPVDEFAEGRHLHLSGYTLLDPGSRSAGLVALEHARAAGHVDLGRPGVGGAAAGGRRPTRSSAGRAAPSLLLPNAEEAAVLTGARDPEAAAWALARDGREVVITLGAGGALWSDGERVERARRARRRRRSTRPAPATRSRPAGSPRGCGERSRRRRWRRRTSPPRRC